MSEWQVYEVSKQELCEYMRKIGKVYNGMTLDYLREKFGAENVKHEPGIGFYVRDTAA